MFGVAEDHDSNPIKIGLGKLKGRPAAARQVRVGQPDPHRLLGDRRRMDRHPSGHRRDVRAGVGPRAAAGRQDRPRLSRALHQCALAGRSGSRRRRRWAHRPRRRRPSALLGQQRGQRSMRCCPMLRRRWSASSSWRTAAARSGFQLMAQRYLDAPLLARRGGRRSRACPPPPSAGSPRSWRMPRSSSRSSSSSPWTDWAGRRHERMIGRPVSMHAMRGISAHSNGFHTCRAIHLLQILLGSIDCPGGWRYKPPFPRHMPAGAQAGRQARRREAEHAAAGAAAGFPARARRPADRGRRHAGADRQGVLVGGADRRPRADAHGHRQRPQGRSLSDRHAVPVHGEHELELGDEHRRDHGHADRQGRGERRRTRSRASSMPTPIFSEMVAYADLVLPDTTYLERHDCISLFDRPICDADGAGDAIRQPVVKPDRDVRPFQDVLIDLGARLGLPGLVNADGSAQVSRLLSRLHRQSRARARRRHARGLARQGRRRSSAWASAIRASSSATSPMAASGATSCRTNTSSIATPTRAISTGRIRVGFIARPSRSIFQLYSEPLQRFRLAARGHGALQPPEQLARAHRRAFRSAADLVPAVRGGGGRRRQLPAPRGDAAADGDVPLLGFAERVAAADPRAQPALHESADGRAAGSRATTTGCG